jgi:hypothetical protein
VDALDDLAVFRRMIRARSDEHERAVRLLVAAGLHAPALAILRQELDSLVRAYYLLHCPPEVRVQLLSASVEGEKWEIATINGRRRKVSDKEMVDLATETDAWVRRVYDVGSALVHLSHVHDYGARDPLASMDPEERRRIVLYVNDFHRAILPDDASFEEIAAYAPQILTKIRNNLDGYLIKLGPETGLGAQ